MKNNNKLIMSIIVSVVVGFIGGMLYQQSRGSSLPNLQNMSASHRQQVLQQLGIGGGRGGFGQNTNRGGNRGSGFVNGEILSKDDKSITVKLNDGGSRIVFFSSATSVGKTVDGAVSDLDIGKQVVVNGTSNSDGSVTAQSIQIRPTPPSTPSIPIAPTK